MGQALTCHDGRLQVTRNALNHGDGGGGQYQQGSPYINGGRGGGMNPYASPYGGIAQAMHQIGGSGVVGRPSGSSSYMQQQGGAGGGGGLGMQVSMQMQMAMQYNPDMTTPLGASPYGQYQVAVAASMSPFVGRGGGGGDYGSHASPHSHQQQRYDNGYNSHDRRYARYDEHRGYDDHGREEQRGSSRHNDRDGDYRQQRRLSYQDQRRQSYQRYDRYDDRRR
jgi:hypothetical protein